VVLTTVKRDLATLESRCTDLEEEQKQRRAEAETLANAERTIQSRLLEQQLATLRATDSTAQAYSDKEARQLGVREWTEKREQLRAERDQLQEELQASRGAKEERTKLAYSHESAMKDFVYRRDDIAKRIREDYQVELHTFAEVPPLPQPLEEMQEEIEKLRAKIKKLGPVNLEALEQLTVEEAEEKRIRTECDDLTNAAKTLLQIIEQINVESRKAFSETLATIRTHFQELFRKLFGGGMADIILEDPTDILETGIEITARPPGKELRSISLLSGGEKTMTAIALLLAIFRSRPSPFCLLDEVDAALDEANTARLADIINEFREKSQFIIVTHKKRTMSMADVLHGVTMQESGVSKQVTTRIEDYHDDSQSAA
jgi:chromosome segregation protein